MDSDQIVSPFCNVNVNTNVESIILLSGRFMAKLIGQRPSQQTTSLGVFHTTVLSSKLGFLLSSLTTKVVGESNYNLMSYLQITGPPWTPIYHCIKSDFL